MASSRPTRTIPPPNVIWAQRKDKLLLTIKLDNCTDPNITLEDGSLYFKGNGGPGKTDHEVLLEFYKEVDPETSKYRLTGRYIYFVITKKETSQGFWPRLLKDSTKVHYLKTDFDKWKDEDDSDEEPQEDPMMQAMGGVQGSASGIQDITEDEFATDHEVELNAQENGEGNYEWDNCTKNPGHPNMVSVKDLTMTDIPEEWSCPYVFECTKSFSHLVVKITVHYISPERPDRYPLSQLRGQHCSVSGTGLVIFGDMKELSMPNIECTSKNCSIPKPHQTTPSFHVMTATHVIYNSEEAASATVEFFYDCDAEESRSDIIKAEVVDIFASSISRDTCTLVCVSHNLQLFQNLRDHCFAALSLTLPPKIPEKSLVVIVSHPHGYHKQVSFGRVAKLVERPEHDKGVAEFYNEKVKDVLKGILENHPEAMNKGYFTRGNSYSSDGLHKLEQFTQLNPEGTFADFANSTYGNLQNGSMPGAEGGNAVPFGFLVYTTSTCPGSSGASVLVFFPKGGMEERRVIPFAHVYHSRSYNQNHNASGKAWLSPQDIQRMRLG